MKGSIFKVHHIDAREVDSIVKGKIVDVTITSPPYFDLKDYGTKKQIGYGQKYLDYLEDLKLVFQKVFSITKETGSLWVIINTFKKNNEIVPLPFDFSNKIKEVGWKLQEIIIWSKDRTVPWTHKGQMRHMFEYILVFSKTNSFKHYIDRIRDFETLKKWWVKYPERYNPKGKIPEEIWNFDIPTQGSWGNDYVAHFCPLPPGLVARVIQLTTNEKDVVLDPFSGSGAVIAQAAFSNRNYIGCELNNEYIKMFNRYLRSNLHEKRREYKKSLKNRFAQDIFSELILNLRILKYGRVLRTQLVKKGFKKLFNLYAEKKPNMTLAKHKHASAIYILLVANQPEIKSIKECIDSIIMQPPLSKYGIEPEFEILSNKEEFLSRLRGRKLFRYKSPVTHKYFERLNIKEFKRDGSIISPIKVDLNEKDFE